MTENFALLEFIHMLQANADAAAEAIDNKILNVAEPTVPCRVDTLALVASLLRLQQHLIKHLVEENSSFADNLENLVKKIIPE